MLWPWKKKKGPSHLKTGVWGEKVAAKELKRKGYRILGTRIRVGRRDELDLVARDGEVLVFVEVKTRRTTTFGRPIEAVDQRKRQTLSRAAVRYMSKLRERPAYFRFDVVEVVGEEGPEAPRSTWLKMHLGWIGDTVFVGKPWVSKNAWASVLLLMTSTPLLAQEDVLGTLSDWGSAWYEENIDHEVVTEWLAATAEDWSGLWQHVSQQLDTGSLEDLAWMADEAEVALEYMEEMPELAPYADWLRQRLDYFSMADHVTRTFPTPQETRTPPRAKRSGSLTIPPRPKSIPPPKEVRVRRENASQSTAVWKQKLRNRPLPERAQALVPRMKKIFKDEGMPEELVWLAEVESSFNPQAKSPVGAAGLYQFMPATAEQYGMKVKPKDERLIPDKNALGAARYLRKLYDRFGSWPLALAAYNAGQGRVSKLLKAHGGSSFEDIANYLPSETKMYVPKVLATVELREGVASASIPAPRG